MGNASFVDAQAAPENSIIGGIKELAWKIAFPLYHVIYAASPFGV